MAKVDLNNYLKTKTGLDVLLVMGYGMSVVEAIEKAPTFALGCPGCESVTLGDNKDVFDTLFEMGDYAYANRAYRSEMGLLSY